LPVAAALGTEAEFRLSGRLGERPIAPLLEVLRANGCRTELRKDNIRISGAMLPGEYLADASASSQFLSGPLLALPKLPQSRVKVAGTVSSKDYVNLTIGVMSRFGAVCRYENSAYSVDGAYCSPGGFFVGGDWSSAAVWIAANALGGCIELSGLSENSLQGDRSVQALLTAIRHGGAVIDCGNVPDLVPVMAVAAAVTAGETVFYNAARLRGKESDRLYAVTSMLNTLGGNCEETADGLRICGVPRLHGAVVDSFGDHRIAMAAAIAAAAADSAVTICGVECVAKSYPDFWRDYQLLGGKVT